MGTEAGEQCTDGVTVADDHPVDSPHLARLGLDVEAARDADERKRGLGTGAGHLERGGPARFGERAVGKEGTAPGSHRVAGCAGDDLGRQAPDRAPALVEQTRLTGERLAVTDDTQHITIAALEAGPCTTATSAG